MIPVGRCYPGSFGLYFGKGNLIFRDYGKQVYTIASREKNRAIRVYEKYGVLKDPAFGRFGN